MEIKYLTENRCNCYSVFRGGFNWVYIIYPFGCVCLLAMQMYSYGVIVILTVVYHVQYFAVQLYVPRLYLYSDFYHTNVTHHIIEILLWTYWLLCFCCCQQCYYSNCLKQIKWVICLSLNQFTLTNPRQHSYSFQNYCNCTMNYNDKQFMSVYVLSP